MPVTLIATLTARAETREQLLLLLESLVDPTRAEDGCLNYDLHVDAENDRVFVFYEKWRSQQDLDAHMRSSHLGRLLDRMDVLLAEPIKVQRLDMIRPVLS